MITHLEYSNFLRRISDTVSINTRIYEGFRSHHFQVFFYLYVSPNALTLKIESALWDVARQESIILYSVYNEKPNFSYEELEDVFNECHEKTFSILNGLSKDFSSNPVKKVKYDYRN